ncbi:serine hydrolase [Chryseobacterium sp.]|uniref:serine hydrolase domain-containing protein n=1 Tax=Chryseobacterium sp. TaxID=1871047 RepID=UPI0025B89E4F|nr:serine hydrolase [Chryseobacterium sp.]
MRFILLFVFYLLPSFFYGQIPNIADHEKIENPIHKNNLNTIIFLSKPISLENIRESDFINHLDFHEDKDLDLRIFMDNSLLNYLHQLDPSLTEKELLQKGNYQFSFYVDGKMMYQENLNTRAGTAESKKVKTTFRIPLISSSNEDSWGRFLWMRFYFKGNGADALEAGNHILKIEIRPYLNTSTVKTGKIIASGQLHVYVPQKNISENLIAVQPIQSDSGWKISDETFNTEKIRLLNLKIAENRLREITSVVVIKNGKLLLEEYFNSSGRDSLQDTRSVGKSFSSALTGIAVQDGYLKSENQNLKEFYELRKFANYSPKKDSVTIKSLLTMSSGFEGNDDDYESPGNEENMYPTSDWVKFTLDLPMTKNEIGRNWSYFTAGVVVTGDILDRAVRKG